MADKTICMGCMSELGAEDTKCTRCGYPSTGVNPPEYMRVRTVVGGRYLVGRVLEVSGDSAVYMGLDKQDNTPVTIREFFPDTLCERDGKGLPKVLEGSEVAFDQHKRKFLACARAVGRLRDVLAAVPNFDIFEENGTAYSISEYCEGMGLERYVRTKGPLSYEQARQLFLPLIDAMSTIHATGVLHLGICPKNVLMDSEGHLRIKNFCIPETHTVNTDCRPVLITGYAAPEQYETGATCTAAADVYALAATMYFALTGKTPMESTARTKKNEELLIPASVAETLPDHVKESLSRAMRLSPNHRTQTARQLWDELTATSAVAALMENEPSPDERPRKKKSGRGWLWLIFVGLVLALAVLAVSALSGLGYINLGNQPTVTTTTQPDLTVPPTTTTELVVKPTDVATVAVQDVCGQSYTALEGTTLTGNMKLELKGYEFSDLPAGTILSQSPVAGEPGERGGVVAVVVSAGPAERSLPDLTGWSEEHAKLYLEALGYRVGESMLLQVSDLDKGLVAKTSPAAGASVKVGDTVTLWVSNVEQQQPTPEADPQTPVTEE